MWHKMITFSSIVPTAAMHVSMYKTTFMIQEEQKPQFTEAVCNTKAETIWIWSQIPAWSNTERNIPFSEFKHGNEGGKAPEKYVQISVRFDRTWWEVAPSSKTKHRTVSHFSAHFLYPKIQQTYCSLWRGGETDFNNRLSDRYTLTQSWVALLQLGWSLFLGCKNVNRSLKQKKIVRPIARQYCELIFTMVNIVNICHWVAKPLQPTSVGLHWVLHPFLHQFNQLHVLCPISIIGLYHLIFPEYSQFQQDHLY